ncbi:glycosyltransferase family 4 protein [Cellulomonas sp. Y8]|uniref:glycosyltransferase family 4 protein n=1 Tax=Cellulomonas sp. Y8 TaxID=2591145 RepID=UPI0011CCCC2E|nr:glycosyltransferase family 4 protein [Cellulomonas sp. Y8]
MRVAFVTSICVPFDAISGIVRQCVLWAEEAGHETLLFAHDSAFDDLATVRVRTAAEVVTHPFYRSADVVVLDMGIYYTLFGALLAAPEGARTLVRFHNVTPRALVPSWQHDVIDRSIEQLALLRFVDAVLCDSEYNRTELRGLGIETPAVVRDLPVAVALDPPAAKPSADDGVLRVAFVGRFVRSKGPLELIAALDRALPGIPQDRVELDMVGNAEFSDADLLEQTARACEDLQRRSAGRLTARVHRSAPDELRDSVLRRADLFVLPTYHEGFCVPAVEALAGGCDVITYDNSNMPHVLDGLGTLVPTGDVAALGAAIAARAVLRADPVWDAQGYAASADAARRYVARFDPGPIREQFLRDLDPAAGSRP